MNSAPPGRPSSIRWFRETVICAPKTTAANMVIAVDVLASSIRTRASDADRERPAIGSRNQGGLPHARL